MTYLLKLFFLVLGGATFNTFFLNFKEIAYTVPIVLGAVNFNIFLSSMDMIYIASITIAIFIDIIVQSRYYYNYYDENNKPSKISVIPLFFCSFLVNGV